MPPRRHAAGRLRRPWRQRAAGHRRHHPGLRGHVHAPAVDRRRFTNPVATFVPREGSPSGMAIVGDHADVARLRGQRLRRVALDGGDSESLLVGQFGRLRAAAVAPDGSLWPLTSNRDNLINAFDPPATMTADDDRVLRLTL